MRFIYGAHFFVKINSEIKESKIKKTIFVENLKTWH